MILYMRLQGSPKIKSGGLLSSEFLADKFRNRGIKSHNIHYVSFANLILKLVMIAVRINIKEEDIFLAEPRLDNSLKDKAKIYLNTVFYHLFLRKKYQQELVLLIDGALPINFRKFKKLYKGNVLSFVRSSPACLAFSSPNLKMMLFREQLKASTALICASQQIAQNWCELTDSLNKTILELKVPLIGLGAKLPSLTIQTAHDKLDLIMIVGATGPRKGVDQFLDILSKSSISDRVRIHIFGQNRASVPYCANLDVVNYGFQKFDPLTRTDSAIRIFTSHSECYSRAQIESIISGSPTLFNVESFDPEFLKYVQTQSLCFGINDIIERLETYCIQPHLINDLCPDNMPTAQNYNSKFENQFNNIVEFAVQLR